MDDEPAVEPHASGYLAVGDEDAVYWETVGNPDGTPVVWLHGGPGSGSTVAARRQFDPNRFRAVLFDQRGCGRSRPLAGDLSTDLTRNTTQQLVADLEELRHHLRIDRWMLVGVSWGVTLALVYAQTYPDQVIAMVLGAITNGRRQEIDWITRGMRRFFPDEWERFVGLIPEGDRDGDLCAAYARLLADPDTDVRAEAARRWCQWEDTHVSLMPGWKPHPRYDDPEFRMTFARLVTHFWSHDCFLSDNQILNGMERIAAIPSTLVHGRYDISAPLDIAWRLHRHWPASRLVVLDDAGHGGAGFTAALVAAIDDFGAVN